jgi:hypothetical protein
MIFGQAAGHLLGTTIKNRPGSPVYFFEILALGLLPWTILLGWLWRWNHWRNLDSKSKDGWLLLSVWGIFTFALFSFSHAKLPAYILPIFPALAVLLAWRFFKDRDTEETIPVTARQICAAGALLLPTTFPLLARSVFHEELPPLMNWQILIVFAASALILWRVRNWKMLTTAALAVGLSLLGFFVTVGEIPQFETSLRRNQTFKPLGLELNKNFQLGDTVVCWGRFPQGLPFYSGGVICATNRSYLGGMDLTQVPFAFPGNRERLGDLLLPDGNALARLLQGGGRVWVVVYGDTIEGFQKNHTRAPLRPIARSGEWQLFSSR